MQFASFAKQFQLPSVFNVLMNATPMFLSHLFCQDSVYDEKCFDCFCELSALIAWTIMLDSLEKRAHLQYFSCHALP